MHDGIEWRHVSRLLISAIMCVALLSVSGCATLQRQVFSLSDQESATVPGYDRIRHWADAPARELAPSILPERERIAERIDVLAISGGGSAGAFAAGLLKGWSASGKRPSFSIVTGVSTGALIAPFAFLGPEYDGQLEKLYRSGIAVNLQRPHDPISILSGQGLLDPTPLRTMIEAHATSDLIKRIAVEHRKGRRLFVVTTNIDAQRPVLWDIGKIASSGRADSVALVRRILLASASIPGAYPPVLINSHSESTAFQEMHVDGGATMQLFLPTESLSIGNSIRRPQDVHLWLIVNNTLPPEFAITANSTLSVAYRSLSTLMKSHAEQNARIVYEVARRSRYDFNFAFIDRSFKYDPARPFGNEYMEAVFTNGEQRARSGSVWSKSVENVLQSRDIDTSSRSAVIGTRSAVSQ